MEIKAPRSLRSLREIYNHNMDVFFPHAEDAKVAKILLYNAMAGEVAGYARQESAEAGRKPAVVYYIRLSSCLCVLPS